MENKLVIGLFMLVWVLYGGYQASQLPIDTVPDITNNQVQVITTAPSLGAEDVERLITFPIEQAISNIPGLKESRSLSRFGLSLITIVFDDNADVYWARQQVTERLAQVAINVNANKPELAPVTTGLGEIYQYVIRPEKGFEKQYSPAGSPMDTGNVSPPQPTQTASFTAANGTQLPVTRVPGGWFTASLRGVRSR